MPGIGCPGIRPAAGCLHHGQHPFKGRCRRGGRPQQAAAEQPAGPYQQRSGGLLQHLGIEGLVGETGAAISQKTTETPFAIRITADEHHTAGALRIPLQAGGLHAPFGKKELKGFPDRIAAEATQEGRRGSQPGQSTSHVGGSTTKPVAAIAGPQQAGLTSDVRQAFRSLGSPPRLRSTATTWRRQRLAHRQQPIHESLAEAEHLGWRGVAHQAAERLPPEWARPAPSGAASSASRSRKAAMMRALAAGKG